jgi:hypothetical protein
MSRRKHLSVREETARLLARWSNAWVWRQPKTLPDRSENVWRKEKCK